MNKRKIWFIIAVILISVAVTVVYFDTLASTWSDYDVNLRVARLLNIDNPEGYNTQKKILLWTSMFNDDWFYLGRSGHFDTCPKYNACLITRSRMLFEPTEFDAILFHSNEVNRHDIPLSRDPRQKYIFVNLESPENRPLRDSFFENFFNLTMTYRLDSDIPWPYFIVRDMYTKKMVAPLQGVEWSKPSYDSMRFILDTQFEEKKKMVAWLVSNCQTLGKRELYVKELMKYVGVDQIGKCGDRNAPTCPRSSPASTCFEEVIEPGYFFYLSFENTLCQDYVTEKLGNALRQNIIPVVYGGANYSLYAPPHSYIDALDFDSPKDLANYLTELSQNKEEYLKYFWWKRFYTVDTPAKWTLCNLCELLHVQMSQKTYSPISDWYEKDKCPIQSRLNGHEHATKQLRSHLQRNLVPER